MRAVRWLRVAEVLVVGTLMVGPPVEAQVHYVDENGVSHWVASPDEVPERYRAKAETPRPPEPLPAPGVSVEQKISDACQSQFEFALNLTKKLWQEEGKRVPIRQYLPPECAAEISEAHPETQLDE